VEVEYACAPDAAGSEYVLSVADQQLTGRVASTGGAETWTTAPLGTVAFPAAGTYMLRIQARQIAHGSLMNLKQLVLRNEHPYRDLAASAPRGDQKREQKANDQVSERGPGGATRPPLLIQASAKGESAKPQAAAKELPILGLLRKTRLPLRPGFLYIGSSISSGRFRIVDQEK
jgi:hypothetical protein